MLKPKDMAHWPAAKLSAAALYALLAVAAVVFCAFFFIGFDKPFDEDPNFIEPRFTTVLIGFVWLVLAIAVVAAGVSVVRSMRVRDKSHNVSNGIPVARIALATGGGLIVCLLLTFLLGSAETMLVNGIRYTDRMWLKVADMFIYTAIILLLVAIIAVVCSNVRNARSRR